MSVQRAQIGGTRGFIVDRSECFIADAALTVVSVESEDGG